ncbi:MAG: hypothetical protein U9O18_10155, partial [Chloroflexota bacterium]|nr:hypothetical protein [Chloroflexota bacterium]
MSTATNPWGRLSLGGKILLPLIALIILVAVAGAILWVSGVGVALTEWVIDTGEANIEILRFL